MKNQNLSKIAIIMYSHSSYSDIWPIFFGQTKKYLKGFKKYLFIDKKIDGIPEDYAVILYEDTLEYPKKFASCLKSVKEEYSIFHHEDMFLYAEPKLDRIAEYIDILENSTIDIIRFLKAGGIPNDTKFQKNDDLNIIPDGEHLIFAIQPSLLKTELLLKIYKECPGESIWQFETRSPAYCMKKGVKGLYVHKNEGKRGRLHWDSHIYPYVATAIVKGKWNYKWYRKELNTLLNEYKINKRKRGTNEK